MSFSALRLDQLSVDLYQGTGAVSNLDLDLSSLNEQLSVIGIPLEVLDGFVRHIQGTVFLVFGSCGDAKLFLVEIPWSSLLSDPCRLTLRGLELSVQLAEEVMTMQESARKKRI